MVAHQHSDTSDIEEFFPAHPPGVSEDGTAVDLRSGIVLHWVNNTASRTGLSTTITYVELLRILNI